MSKRLRGIKGADAVKAFVAAGGSRYPRLKPWHLFKFKLRLTPSGRNFHSPTGKPVELCPSGY